MKNKLNKLLTFVFTIAFLMISTVTTSVYAGPMFDPITPVAIDDGDGPGGGTEGGLLPSVTPALPDATMEDMIDEILGMLAAIGYAVAAGMLIYVGIKYVMASANEKADLKNSSIKYVAGAIILFSISATYDIVEALMIEIGGS